MKLPNQRWDIASPNPKKIELLAKEMQVSNLIIKIILNRGVDTSDLARIYLNPNEEILPPPLAEFPDLYKSINLLIIAIEKKHKIAICGDYDADGMTSTSLLLRALKYFGGDVYYKIPNRIKDGYGINKQIVEDFSKNGVKLILTVDNGITAYEPIKRAAELGLSVIITDHHDIPKRLPPADAILNPKLLPNESPYSGLAGVGVAYVLALTLSQTLNKTEGIIASLLELFTLGTIADLAPLTGVNRRWLKQGLKQLPNSQLPGIQALIKVSGISDEQKQLKSDDIGFKLGPRINAVGRIGEPKTAIELLTTDNLEVALEKALECEEINKIRKSLCERIEKEAIDLIENIPLDYQKKRVLIVVQHKWHHGVIGIVASRLVERYGVPVFIGTYEEDDINKIRGSARGIPEFDVFHALQYCDDLLDKFGGHKAAGGFNLKQKNLSFFEKKLSEFAHQYLQLHHIKPLIKIDSAINFKDIDNNLYETLDSLQPWGIGNTIPIFWTPNIIILKQKVIGDNHLKILLAQNDGQQIEAVAWRFGSYYPLPKQLDIAYKLSKNFWNGKNNIQLEIVGIRIPSSMNKEFQSTFEFNGKQYICSIKGNKLKIKNLQGKTLSIDKGKREGLLENGYEKIKTIDVTHQPYYTIVKMALHSLNL